MKYDIIFWIIYMMTLPDMLHIMQQESYQNDGMLRWIYKNPKRAFKRGAVGFFITIIVYLLLSVIAILISKSGLENIEWLVSFPTVGAIITLFVYFIFLFFETHKERKSAKKPLKYTARAVRLMVYNFVVVVLLEVTFIQSFDYDYTRLNIYYPFVYGLLFFAIPVNMIIANWFASPLERIISERFIKKAYKKLKRDEYRNLIKIGITGTPLLTAKLKAPFLSGFGFL